MFGMGLSLINFSIDEIINPTLKSARLHRKRAKLARRSA
jgi:peptide/nickel transport system permease protein